MAYFARGAFVTDPWEHCAREGSGRLLLSPAEWQERRDTLSSEALLGLSLPAGFPVESLVEDVPRFQLVTVAFPKFTDGRGYSMAWLLRTRLNYRNELRAVGDVLFDEMRFMLRCGFDAFEIEDENTARLLRSGRRPDFDRFYQPGLEPELPEGTRPWARRLTTPPRRGTLISSVRLRRRHAPRPPGRALCRASSKRRSSSWRPTASSSRNSWCHSPSFARLERTSR